MLEMLHQLLSYTYFQLFILDIVFTVFVFRGVRRKHFPVWAMAVPTVSLYAGYWLWQLLW